MTPPLSLSHSLPPASFPCALCPVPTSPPARVDQTQTQLEHARIGELEQSLLLEKAQAERLLRELADNRVTRPPPPAARALARGPPGSSVLLFSLSFTAVLVFFSFCALSRREVEGQKRTFHCHRCLWGGGGLALCDFALRWSHGLGMSCETLCLPPSPRIAMTRLCPVQKSGVSWEHSAFFG